MQRSARIGTSSHDWHSSVASNLTRADDAHRQATGSYATSIQGIQGSNTARNKKRDMLHDQFNQKIENTKELSQQLSTRIRSIKSTIDHSEWSLRKLTDAIQALIHPMELCKTRLGMRLKRPKREQVFDAFQQALLAEEQELQRTKTSLQNAAAETQKLIRDLRNDLASLEADLNDKQSSYHIDTLCTSRKKAVEANNAKLDKLYNRSGVPLSEVLPELFQPSEAQESGGRFQERSRQKGTLSIIERAMKLEEICKQRWQATNGLLAATHQSTYQALKRTQTEMGAKVADTEILRQELNKQRRTTDTKIAEMKKCLGLVVERLRGIEKPLAANAERSRYRATRVPREAGEDEVSEALFAQHLTLEEQKRSLQNHVNRTVASLDELENSRYQLMEDIADKEKALNIDRSCAAAKNTAHGQYSYGVAKVGEGQRIFSDTSSSNSKKKGGHTPPYF
mmetsp:Transcript_8812/g.16105  ORF Transcript_8812/g.16105 Transcript_8812/m.16105 type:complete len:453 (+) Transcript_8812:45-1403(+)